MVSLSSTAWMTLAGGASTSEPRPPPLPTSSTEPPEGAPPAWRPSTRSPPDPRGPLMNSAGSNPTVARARRRGCPAGWPSPRAVRPTVRPDRCAARALRDHARRWRCTSPPGIDRRRPVDRPAIVSGSVSRSWREYDDRRRVASALTAAGWGPTARSGCSCTTRTSTSRPSSVPSRCAASPSTSTTATWTTSWPTCSTTPTPRRWSSTRRWATVRPGRRQAAGIAATVVVDDGPPADGTTVDGAVPWRSSSRRARADAPHRAPRGRHLHALHGWHDRDAQGRHVCHGRPHEPRSEAAFPMLGLACPQMPPRSPG